MITEKTMEQQKTMDSESVIQALLAAYGGEERLVSELLQCLFRHMHPANLLTYRQ